MTDNVEEFERDCARVREIATMRVEMFDAGDKSFCSKESRESFQEYLSLRRKWGYDVRSGGLELKRISDEIWDS